MRLGSHALTLALFFAVLIIFLVMGQFFPQELAIPLPGSSIRPVLLLEFAATPQHLIHIFGDVDDPQRAARLAGMHMGNVIDYLLMPAYGLMTFSFFRGVAAELGDRRWALFGWLGLAAALADAIENALMFRIVAAMGGSASDFALLAVPVWTKFGLLALTCAGAAWAFVRMRRWLLALLCLPAPLLFIPGALDPYGLAPTATTMIGLGWAAMAIHAGTRWWQNRQAVR